jgi:hypothetical protein
MPWQSCPQPPFQAAKPAGKPPQWGPRAKIGRPTYGFIMSGAGLTYVPGRTGWNKCVTPLAAVSPIITVGGWVIMIK